MISRDTVSLCVPITAKDYDELRKCIQNVLENDIKLIEFRRDYLQNGEQEDIIYTFLSDIIDEVDIIFTFRDSNEGGQTVINDDDRFKSMSKALEAGCVTYLDIEEAAADKFLKSVKPELLDDVKLIISAHDFESTPEEKVIIKQLEKSGQYGDIVKAAYNIRSEQDLKNLYRAARYYHNRSEKPLIIIGMGELGKDTRIYPEFLHSNLTFAPLEEETGSAPGQLSYYTILNLRKSFYEKEKTCILNRPYGFWEDDDW